MPLRGFHITLKSSAALLWKSGVALAVTATSLNVFNSLDHASHQPSPTIPTETQISVPELESTDPEQLASGTVISITPRIKPDTPQPVLMASLSAIPARPSYNDNRSQPFVNRDTRIRRAPPETNAVPMPRERGSVGGPSISNRKLFGSVEIKFEDEKKIRAWGATYNRFVSDVGQMSRCINSEAQCNSAHLDAWAKDLRGLRGQSTQTIMAEVNRKVNQRRYMSDDIIYGRSDYWASPQEFLERSGDCEDFALMKFASLLALGVDNKDIRLVIGKLADGTPHAFLAVQAGGTEYVMDNREARVFAANSRTGYIPKYSMNLTDRWSHVMPKTRMTS